MAMTTGLVFDIQRCSLHDGPGIRTTVFLKGCPLHCMWCHNPESISFKPQLSFNRDKCVDCLACVQACPHGAQQAVEGKHVLERDPCQACGACVAACLNGALRMIGEERGVAEIMAEVEKDADYYRESGGGLTLSGGEPLVQFEFTLELLRAARARGIHTCVETCGFARQERYAHLLPSTGSGQAPYVDLFLFDYKATDSARHRQFTGVPNEPILANLEFLYWRGAAIILRCPLVPGVNDAPEHLEGIARLSARYPNLMGIELMAYHEMGRDKGVRVGREDALPGLKTTEEATKAAWLEVLRQLGCKKAVIG